MNFTLSASSNLPQGAAVKVYERSLFSAVPLVPQGAPPGSGEAFSGTMGASSLTATGLAPETRYVAHAQVGSDHRYTSFKTAETLTGSLPSRSQDLSSSHAYTSTVADLEQVLTITAGASTATVTLMDASAAGDGAIQWVRKIDSGVGRVIVKQDTTEVAWLSAQYDTIAFRSTGSNWRVLMSRISQLNEVYSTPGAVSVVIPPAAISVARAHGGRPAASVPVARAGRADRSPGRCCRCRCSGPVP